MHKLKQASYLFFCTRLGRKESYSADACQCRLSQNILDYSADMPLPGQASKVGEDANCDVALLLGQKTAAKLASDSILERQTRVLRAHCSKS